LANPHFSVAAKGKNGVGSENWFSYLIFKAEPKHTGALKKNRPLKERQRLSPRQLGLGQERRVVDFDQQFSTYTLPLLSCAPPGPSV
jgi:hypothetical protein